MAGRGNGAEGLPNVVSMSEALQREQEFAHKYEHFDSQLRWYLDDQANRASVRLDFDEFVDYGRTNIAAGLLVPYDKMGESEQQLCVKFEELHANLGRLPQNNLIPKTEDPQKSMRQMFGSFALPVHEAYSVNALQKVLLDTKQVSDERFYSAMTKMLMQPRANSRMVDEVKAKYASSFSMQHCRSVAAGDKRTARRYVKAYEYVGLPQANDEEGQIQRQGALAAKIVTNFVLQPKNRPIWPDNIELKELTDLTIRIKEGQAREGKPQTHPLALEGMLKQMVHRFASEEFPERYAYASEEIALACGIKLIASSEAQPSARKEHESKFTQATQKDHATRLPDLSAGESVRFEDVNISDLQKVRRSRFPNQGRRVAGGVVLGSVLAGAGAQAASAAPVDSPRPNAVHSTAPAQPVETLIPTVSLSDGGTRVANVARPTLPDAAPAVAAQAEAATASRGIATRVLGIFGKHRAPADMALATHSGREVGTQIPHVDSAVVQNPAAPAPEVAPTTPADTTPNPIDAIVDPAANVAATEIAPQTTQLDSQEAQQVQSTNQNLAQSSWNVQQQSSSLIAEQSKLLPGVEAITTKTTEALDGYVDARMKAGYLLNANEVMPMSYAVMLAKLPDSWNSPNQATIAQILSRLPVNDAHQQDLLKTYMNRQVQKLLSTPAFSYQPDEANSSVYGERLQKMAELIVNSDVQGMGQNQIQAIIAAEQKTIDDAAAKKQAEEAIRNRSDVTQPAPNAPETNVSADAVDLRVMKDYGVPEAYAPIYLANAKKYGVPVMYLVAQGHQESGFDPHAQSMKNKPVSKRAKGISQFMDGTWDGWARRLGFPADASPYDPHYAIEAQAAMMRAEINWAKSAHPDKNPLSVALIAYNGGHGGVTANGNGRYAESRAYARIIMGTYSDLKGQVAQRLANSAAHRVSRSETRATTPVYAVPVSNEGWGLPMRPEDYVRYQVTCSFDGYSAGFMAQQRAIRGKSVHHDGTDFGAPIGTPVLAMRDGVVTSVQNYPGDDRIKVVVVDHGIVNGKHVFVNYEHLSRFEVSVGEHVTQGQELAKSGKSGTASPHLHVTFVNNDDNNNGFVGVTAGKAAIYRQADDLEKHILSRSAVASWLSNR
jgi:murein DD-endopeptidase MepM/ murein hydrolase activator NlpD